MSLDALIRVFLWKKCVYFQVYFQQRFRNAVVDVTTDPKADVDSDHNLLICNFRLRLRIEKAKKPTRPRIDWETCDEVCRAEYRKVFWAEYEQGTDTTFNNAKRAFETAQSTLPITKSKHKQWMTPDTQTHARAEKVQEQPAQVQNYLETHQERMSPC